MRRLLVVAMAMEHVERGRGVSSHQDGGMDMVDLHKIFQREQQATACAASPLCCQEPPEEGSCRGMLLTSLRPVGEVAIKR